MIIFFMKEHPVQHSNLILHIRAEPTMTTDYSASAESRLSLPVAARVQTFPVVSPLEAANLPSLLQLHYSLDGRRRRRASLRFDSGPLCPSALLGADLFVGEDYDNKIYAILDAQPTSPDDVMLRAARALRVAAARAAVDVGGAGPAGGVAVGAGRGPRAPPPSRPCPAAAA